MFTDIFAARPQQRLHPQNKNDNFDPPREACNYLSTNIKKASPSAARLNRTSTKKNKKKRIKKKKKVNLINKNAQKIKSKTVQKRSEEKKKKIDLKLLKNFNGHENSTTHIL